MLLGGGVFEQLYSPVLVFVNIGNTHLSRYRMPLL